MVSACISTLAFTFRAVSMATDTAASMVLLVSAVISAAAETSRTVSAVMIVDSADKRFRAVSADSVIDAVVPLAVSAASMADA